MEKIYHVNINQKKKTKLTILISDEVGFAAKEIARNRERHCMMIKAASDAKCVRTRKQRRNL